MMDLEDCLASSVRVYLEGEVTAAQGGFSTRELLKRPFNSRGI
jgi:hypothetical protein